MQSANATPTNYSGTSPARTFKCRITKPNLDPKCHITDFIISKVGARIFI